TSMSNDFLHSEMSISSAFIDSESASCERRDSNPHGFPHWILSPARLPIPPLSQHLFDCACLWSRVSTGQTVRLTCAAHGSSLQRKSHGKCRALAHSTALSFDKSGVHFDKMAHDSEPQAEAAVLPGVRAIGLPELIKDVREEFRIHAG